MTDWIEDEFKNSHFKDGRLKSRFLKIASSFDGHPSSSISQQSNDWGEAKGAYRFFKNPQTSEDDFFSAHQEKTAIRASAYPFILAIQDSSTLNYQGHSRKNGMGLIRNDSWGCHIHSTIALAPNGHFLGVLSNLMWSRDPTHKKKINDRPKYKDGEEKESEKWNEGVLESLSVLKGRSKILSICDRESDSGSFILHSLDYDSEFLIRHSSPRKILESHLNSFDYIKQSPSRGTESVLITNKWSDNRGKSFRVKDEHGKYERIATLHYQFIPITTEVSMDNYKKTISLNIVRVFEEGDTDGKIDWILLTSLPIESLSDAKNMVLYYSLRWRIELFFKTLKSGCSIEKCRLSNFDRMKKFIFLATIIAWRINWIKYLSETNRDLPAENILSNTEIEVLKKRNKYCGTVNIALALKWVSRLGGHLNRKNDGPPGIQTIWKGLSRLQDLEEGFLLA